MHSSTPRCLFVTSVLSLVLVFAPFGRAQSINAYGYDAAGRYHTDNYGTSANLQLNTNIDVSDLRAKLIQSFGAFSNRPPPTWSDPSSYPIRASQPPQKSPSEIYWEKLTARANAGEISAIVEISHEELYFQHDYRLAVQWLQVGANKGRSDLRQLLYALLLDPAKGVQDLDRAAALLPQLAADDPKFKEPWGQALIAGDHFPRDVAKGRALREEAAACARKMGIHGNLLALGHDFATGEGGMPRDPERAISCYADGIDSRDAGQVKDYYLLVLSQPDCVQRHRRELVQLIECCIKSYSAPRLEGLKRRIMETIAPKEPIPDDPRTVAGLYLLDPRCGKPDYGSARFQFDLSRDKLAKRELGLLSVNELAGPPDYTKAAENFELAGDAISQRELGLLYDRGLGRPRDHAKAMSLFQHAAPDDPTGEAYYYIAIALASDYRRKEKTPSREGPSLDSLQYDSQSAAEQGSLDGEPRAKSLFAQWLLKDANLPANSEEDREKIYTRVRELWTSADSARVPEAAYFLGRMDEQGLGGTKDEARAWTEYRRASDGGYPPARELVANAMEHGTNGFTADPAAADLLRKQAATSSDR